MRSWGAVGSTPSQRRSIRDSRTVVFSFQFGRSRSGTHRPALRCARSAARYCLARFGGISRTAEENVRSTPMS